MKRSLCLAVLLVLAASAAWGQTWYGLQENGLEPNYRDQDGYGTCWTFGTMASVESNLIKEGLLPQSTAGLSERDLAWHSGYGGAATSQHDSLSLGLQQFFHPAISSRAAVGGAGVLRPADRTGCRCRVGRDRESGLGQRDSASHAMQRRATARAWSRAAEIGWPHVSHSPYVPPATFIRAPCRSWR